ncbi:MAG: cytidine deaminase [Planctomycetes bacterium]|nr:cytidine deaminase [Planctomycetota bacterium]
MSAPDPRRAFSPDDAADLLRVAHAAVQLAYAPYSKVRVGAALVGADGQVYTGCNVENASYGLTICAERSAVCRAVAAGERKFKSIAIATDRPQALMPCGACRQVLAEFGLELTVIAQGQQSGIVQVTLAELLPRAFSPGDLR